jgi:hypothetical protein
MVEARGDEGSVMMKWTPTLPTNMTFTATNLSGSSGKVTKPTPLWTFCPIQRVGSSTYTSQQINTAVVCVPQTFTDA